MTRAFALLASPKQRGETLAVFVGKHAKVTGGIFIEWRIWCNIIVRK